MADWFPHEGAQEEFCSRGEFEVLYGGAAGPGKTDCLISLALRHIDNPNYKGLILRRTFPRLEEIVDRCYERYPNHGGVYRTVQRRWFFPSGASIRLGHMQHEEDKRDYQGKEYQFIGWDELTEFTQSQYEYVTISRSRTKDSTLPVRIRATTNPGGIGHSWVKKRFIDVADPGETYIDPDTNLSRCFIPGRVTDNKTLMREDPGYIKRLEALPEIEKRRLLYGDWDSFEGQIFSRLSMQTHGIDPFQIPPEWEKIMCFDWGFAHPFSCGWYAVDYDGIIYRYREWYGAKPGEVNVGLRMIATDVARKILEIEQRENDNVRIRIADPNIFYNLPKFRNKECIGQTVSEDFMSQGVYFMKADNDRLHGIQQVHKRLQLVESVEDGEIIEHPQFFAFNDQPHFWRTMTELRESPRNPEDVDTDQEDHIYDEFRYMCMSRPVRPRKIEAMPRGSFMATRNRLIRAKKYATQHGVSLQTAYSRVR